MPRRDPAISDFLTDGALAALCEGLTQIAGAEVTLHDRDGRRITPAEGASPPWTIGDIDDTAREVSAALTRLSLTAGTVTTPPTDDTASLPTGASGPFAIVPLSALDHTIGAIVVRPDKSRKGVSLTRLRAIVRKLASTISELCGQELRYRRRSAELNILFRLSSLLVEARDVDSVLNVALRSAVEVLEADAGSVHLLDESEENLRLRAGANLPPEFVERFDSFPLQRAADRDELESRVHTLADLDESRRAELLPDLQSFGFADMVACGLVFKDRAIGIIRLYRRTADTLEPAERTLLQTVAEQAAAAAASARLIETERRHREVQRQLDLAADVQQRMLPTSVPSIPGLDIAARYMSCFDLGGDFYDFINLSGHLGLLVGDVSGKGVPAALLMASVRAHFRVLATGLYDLDRVVARVNETMARDTQSNEFATVFYGVIDPTPRDYGGGNTGGGANARRLTYCNAGHDPPLLVRAPRPNSDHRPELIELTTGGMVVGIDPTQKYDRGIIDLYPGDTLLLHTDGVTDAMNFQNQKFTRNRLRESLTSFLAADPSASARAIADHITWEVRRFIGLRDPIDDSTIVVLRVGH